MPEGDTLHRTASALRDVLAGREVVAARGRPDGVPLERVVGTRVERVEAAGKHLLIGFSAGVTLHTHLRMHGSWHRYRPGEAWKRPASRAVAVLEVSQAVAVCFDAPTVELLDTRALALHPTLRRLGPDLARPDADAAEVLRRLRAPERAGIAIGDALLDQTAGAGLGNVYRSEVCFIERVDPMTPVRDLPDDVLARLVDTGSRLLRANLDGGARATTPDAIGSPPGSGGPRARGENLWVYRRAGRPCRRCGTAIRASRSGSLARSVYWCPSCQPRVTARSEPERVPG